MIWFWIRNMLTFQHSEGTKVLSVTHLSSLEAIGFQSLLCHSDVFYAYNCKWNVTFFAPLPLIRMVAYYTPFSFHLKYHQDGSRPYPAHFVFLRLHHKHFSIFLYSRCNYPFQWLLSFVGWLGHNLITTPCCWAFRLFPELLWQGTREDHSLIQ